MDPMDFAEFFNTCGWTTPPFFPIPQHPKGFIMIPSPPTPRTTNLAERTSQMIKCLYSVGEIPFFPWAVLRIPYMKHLDCGQHNVNVELAMV